MNIRSPTALLYLALSIMSANRKNYRKSIIPDILYLGDEKIVMDLIRMFGGSSIYIPTAEEFILDLRVVLYGYYSIAEGKSDDWFMLTYQVDGNQMRSIRARLQHWLKSCTPDELECIKLMPGALDLKEKAP